MKNNTLIFIHVPKTAGTSFYELIEKNYEKKNRFVFNINKGKNPIPKLLKRAKKNDIQVVYGHGTYGLHEIFLNSTYLSFVREPISHTISLYNYIKTSSHSHNHRKVKDLTFKEFILNLKSMHADNIHYRQFTNTLFRIIHPEYYEKEIDADFDLLKYSLEKIHNIYRLEEIEIAEKVIAEKFNWEFKELARLNISQKVDFQIDDEDIEMIKSINHLDYYIYDHAIKLNNDNRIPDSIS